MNLSSEEKEFYEKHLLLPDFGEEKQLMLRKSRVLIVGAGGLGCPVLQYLTAAGVGSIKVIDHDIVSKSNLHRQILYGVDDIGKYKVDVAKEKLSKQNPFVSIEVLKEKFSPENARNLVSQVDVVVDCSDNFSTRYLINDACVLEDTPFVFGAIEQFTGQVAVFNYQNGATYRCIFPNPSEQANNCSDIGVLGILPGIIGNYQALECIKLLTKSGKTLSNQLLLIDVLENLHQKIQLKRGANVQKNIKLEKNKCTMIKSINYSELKERENLFLLDVREEYEFADSNIGGTLIPLGQIPSRMDELPKNKTIAILCERGGRSMQACQFLNQHGFDVVNIEGGMSVIR